MTIEQAERPRSRWLVPPRLRTATDRHEERHATWLELFFDLVFVVAITELSHALVVDHSAAGFLRFAALFVPVYVAWQGYSFYADRFDTDDLVLRLAFFAAMLAIAAMAVQVEDLTQGMHSTGFAVSYIVLRSIMVGLYGRAWIAAPEARPLVRLYGSGYAVAVGIWIVSLAFPAPTRYVLWGIALALDLSLPPLSTRIHRRVPTSSAHVPERWALFTLIVLGESVVAVALATAGSHWRFVSATGAVLGFVAVCGLWWIYFDRQDNVVLRGGTPSVVVYSYAHLPLLMGLAATSAGLRLLIDDASADHLGLGASCAFLGGMVVFILSFVATRVVTVSGRHALGIILKLGTVAVLLVLLALQSALPPVALAAGAALVLGMLVFFERTLFPQEEAV
jgi:low temperature requirement protein LtrA